MDKNRQKKVKHPREYCVSLFQLKYCNISIFLKKSLFESFFLLSFCNKRLT